MHVANLTKKYCPVFASISVREFSRITDFEF